VDEQGGIQARHRWAVALAGGSFVATYDRARRRQRHVDGVAHDEGAARQTEQTEPTRLDPHRSRVDAVCEDAAHQGQLVIVQRPSRWLDAEQGLQRAHQPREEEQERVGRELQEQSRQGDRQHAPRLAGAGRSERHCRRHSRAAASRREPEPATQRDGPPGERQRDVGRALAKRHATTVARRGAASGSGIDGVVAVDVEDDVRRAAGAVLLARVWPLPKLMVLGPRGKALPG
jgi:hypothetical protein